MHVIEDITHPGPKRLSALFELSMWWRIVYGSLRLFLGITLLRLIGEPIAELIYTLMSHELTGPRGDLVLEKIYAILSVHDFTVTYFVACYFIFWGLIDVMLSIFLLRHKLIAFPVSMGLIVIFVVYSLFRYFHTHSLTLLSIIVLDLFILYIIYREYKVLSIQYHPTSHTSTHADPPLHQS